MFSIRSFMILFLSCIVVGMNLCFTSIPSSLKRLSVNGHFEFDKVQFAARDFGNRYQYYPAAILHPSSVSDVAMTVKHIWKMGPRSELTVAARGHGHSLHGQAQAHQGIVINMESLQGPQMQIHTRNYTYIDVSGGELWINILHESLKYGLTPKSWTDYLHLTVGGTLSNAGISGQAFLHGPQISNVHQLEVVTGSLSYALDCTCTRVRSKKSKRERKHPRSLPKKNVRHGQQRRPRKNNRCDRSKRKKRRRAKWRTNEKRRRARWRGKYRHENLRSERLIRCPWRSENTCHCTHRTKKTSCSFWKLEKKWLQRRRKRRINVRLDFCARNQKKKKRNNQNFNYMEAAILKEKVCRFEKKKMAAARVSKSRGFDPNLKVCTWIGPHYVSHGWKEMGFMGLLKKGVG